VREVVGSERRNEALQGAVGWEETQLGLRCHFVGRGGESGEWRTSGHASNLDCAAHLWQVNWRVMSSRRGVYRSKSVMFVHSVQCFCRCVVSSGVEAQSWSCCCSSAFAGILPQEMCFHMSPQFHYFLLAHEQNSHQCHMLYSAARKIDMIDLSHDCNSLSDHRYESTQPSFSFRQSKYISS
jgi:hypothetical protein